MNSNLRFHSRPTVRWCVTIYAKDDDGNESYLPSKPINQATPNFDFYTVRDNGLIIPDIQFTYNSNGASPLNGAEVTVKGIVTASTKIGDLGFLYIQDENATSWAGIWCVGIGLNTYYRNEEVEVTGFVEEFYGMTRLNVTSSSKTGNLGSITLWSLIHRIQRAMQTSVGSESMLVRYEDQVLCM